MPGVLHNLTHKLSTLDRFGEFRHLFHLHLHKVEELTNTLMMRGYITELRSLSHCAKFQERSKLLIMLSRFWGGCQYHSIMPVVVPYFSTGSLFVFLLLSWCVYGNEGQSYFYSKECCRAQLGCKPLQCRWSPWCLWINGRGPHKVEYLPHRQFYSRKG